MKKERLDSLLLINGLTDTREKAKRLILSGIVLVNDRVADKPGSKVAPDSYIRLRGGLEPFVSRGGVKIEAALKGFKVDCRGVTAIDVGTSTGGFTDCLLQRGAKKVFAVDVGYGQIDWRLRNDPRVVLLERKNARFLGPEDINNEKAELAVIDVSFISLKLAFPPLKPLLKEEGSAIALIKPQFEAGRKRVGKGGIVKDPLIQKDVLLGLLDLFREEGWGFGGLIASPIRGRKGNREFLAYLKREYTEVGWKRDIESLIDSLTGPGR